MLPSREYTPYPFSNDTVRRGSLGTFTIVPIWLLVLCFGHELQWMRFSKRSSLCFLDKVCIHQTDAVLKKDGIDSLGSFISASRHMLVCFSAVYLKKLWTVYEIACFLMFHPLSQMTIVLSDRVLIVII